MTPPTLTSLHLLRQQFATAHADNMRKLDEAIANLSAPPPAPPAKTRGQEIAEKMVEESLSEPGSLWFRRNLFGRNDGQTMSGNYSIGKRVMWTRECIATAFDAELARCEREKQAALAAQQEQIAKWLEGRDYTVVPSCIRDGDWKTPTTE